MTGVSKVHRIAYDHQTFSLQSVGGISRYFCELAARVNASTDFESRIIAPIHLNEHLATSELRVTGIYVPTTLRRASRAYRILNDAITPTLSFLTNPSLVHRTYYHTPPPRMSRIPYVVTVFDMIHEILKDQFPAADPTSAHKRRIVERADHVICISQSTANDLIRLFDTDPRKISITHLGFSPAFRVDKNPTLNGKRPYLLYVGQRGGYKNFKRTLQAFIASRYLNTEFDFVVFGGFDFDAEERDLMISADLRENSVRRVTGNDQELAQAYANAHALVYPSEYEGFGIPPLEAMAASCPVACSNTSSLPEVVGDAAVLFDPLNVASIRAAMESICFDSARREQLVRLGKVRANHFSWERCAAETLSIYRRLVSR